MLRSTLEFRSNALAATMTLSQLAERLGAEVDRGLADPLITGVSSIPAARPGCLVFAEEEAAFASALASSAAAVLVSSVTGQVAVASGSKPVLRVPQPRLAFAQAAVWLRGEQPSPSIHATAVIAPGAQIAGDASIGAHVCIEDGVSIGAATIIGSGAVIGAGVRIGSRCRIYPRVVIYPGATLGDRVVIHAGAVLGADGFGYVRDRASGEYTQFPQQGTLIIEDDVEVGANTTIDRGALEETRIARGAKLDNLIHIGHNVSIGRNVVIAAQTGISGSSAVGDGAILGGQVGMGDHALIGPGVIVGGQGGILPRKRLMGAGIVFWGTPAKPVRQYLKELALLARLTSRSGQKTGEK
jgi:UDP-3-O-[3-hydroxymyristoyl] glucosamine N-acyltransferase